MHSFSSWNKYSNIFLYNNVFYPSQYFTSQHQLRVLYVQSHLQLLRCLIPIPNSFGSLVSHIFIRLTCNIIFRLISWTSGSFCSSSFLDFFWRFFKVLATILMRLVGFWTRHIKFIHHTSSFVQPFIHLSIHSLIHPFHSFIHSSCTSLTEVWTVT